MFLFEVKRYETFNKMESWESNQIHNGINIFYTYKTTMRLK